MGQTIGSLLMIFETDRFAKLATETILQAPRCWAPLVSSRMLTISRHFPELPCNNKWTDEQWQDSERFLRFWWSLALRLFARIWASIQSPDMSWSFMKYNFKSFYICTFWCSPVEPPSNHAESDRQSTPYQKRSGTRGTGCHRPPWPPIDPGEHGDPGRASSPNYNWIAARNAIPNLECKNLPKNTLYTDWKNRFHITNRNCGRLIIRVRQMMVLR